MRNNYYGETWENIDFNHTFASTLVVLTQVQTDNDATFVRTRQDNITENGFDLALEEEEANFNDRRGAETIAWLAISEGTGNWDGNSFIAGNTGNNVTHEWYTLDFPPFNNTPKLLGNIATYDGPDPSGLRYQNLNNGNVQIKIEEDTSLDNETNHTTEDIHFLAIDATGTFTGARGEKKLVFDENIPLVSDNTQLEEYPNFSVSREKLKEYYALGGSFSPINQEMFPALENDLIAVSHNNYGVF